MYLTLRRSIPVCALVMFGSISPSLAADATWNQTAGGTYSWNVVTNWTPNTTFPNGAGQVASVNNDIAGNIGINLGEDIIVGTLNVGDSNGTHTFGINNTGGFSLTFQSATAGGVTALNLGATSSIITTIAAPVALGGTSDLAISFAGAQRLTTSGTVTTNGNDISLTGGVVNTASWTVNGDLVGAGKITQSGPGGIVISGAKSFTGTFVLNKGISGASNAGSMSIYSGSIANAAEVVINGYVTPGQGLAQNGGTYHEGNSSDQATNPGQRLTTNTVTFNGGSIVMGGQSAVPGVANNWQMGLENVVDNTDLVNLNSGYSLMSVARGADTLGTRWNITTVDREAGASTYIRSATLGGTARILAANGASLNLGGGGATGTTTMSIIPWMQANNTNNSGQNGAGFATYDTTIVDGEAIGFRALNTGEYAATITAGSTANVKASAVALVSDASINSLVHSSGGVGNIGSGRTLTINSGGLYFSVNNGGVGVSGDAIAGTLSFGAAEGVVWALGAGGTANVNTIGAVIAGSGGLTKTGTGVLVLTGVNTYTGKTHVSAGTLQVGDGVNASNLGDDDVSVHSGATLHIRSADVIDDAAALILDAFGLFNGKVNLDTGINEIVGGLLLGADVKSAGTYGSTSSAADFQSDVWFSGSGIITVVPEPATLVLIGIGTMLIVGRRRGSV